MKKFSLLLFIVIFTNLSYSQRTNLSGLSFCIDPGHGGHNAANDRHVVPDPGTDFWESESNFQKALLLKPMLEELGATCILTRYTNDYPTDVDPTLAERYSIANANNVTWFHSIHSNATGYTLNTTVNSTMMLIKETISSRTAAFPEAKTMSDIMGKHFVKNLRTSGSTTYLDYTFYGGYPNGYNLGVLKGTIMPAELSEGSFHDFYPETRRLMNNYYRKMEAYAIRNSLMQYFGVPADTLCIIAGIIKDKSNASPINNLQVKLYPGDSLYKGDTYNNGFYMFDRLQPGTYKLVYEAPGYVKDSTTFTITTGEIKFIDFTLLNFIPPIPSSVIKDGDTTISVTSYFDFSFTKSMNTESVKKALTFTPAVEGTYSWSNSNMSLRFTPNAPLQSKTNYIIKIDTSACDIGGFKLDGNGDGTPGDAYIIKIRTLVSDDERPFVFSSYPAKNSSLKDFSPIGAVTITFNKLMDTTSLRGAISLRRNSIDVPSDMWFTNIDNRTVVALKAKAQLDTSALYVLIVNNSVKDTYQNTMKAIYYFYVNTSNKKYKSVNTLESFGTGIGNWWQPTNSGSTIGVSTDKTTLALDSSIYYPFSGDKYSAKLNYSFTPGASPNLIREYLASGSAYNTMIDTSMIIQSFVFGDSSKNQIRFCIDDSSTLTKHRVSSWVTIDWYGWKLVEWKFGNVSEIGSWLNPGPVVGPKVRFDSYQLTHDPSNSRTDGSIYFDELSYAELEKNITAVEEISGVIPNEFKLEQNYPNPFNPATNIRINLSESGRIKLVIYDILGKEVSVLKDNHMNAGTYTLVWNASNMPSGVYFAKLFNGSKVSSIKMVLTK